MKSVYFKIAGLTQEQLKEMFDIMVMTGAMVVDHWKDPAREYYGIDEDNEIIYYLDPTFYYGGVEVHPPTPEALREALGITIPLKEGADVGHPEVSTPPEHPCDSIIPLRNVKLKVLSEEHSEAFQKAVFESGGGWWCKGTVNHTSEPYLYVDEVGEMAWDSHEDLFNSDPRREITFTPKTTWEAAYVPEEEEEVEEEMTFRVEGEYTLEELKELISEWEGSGS